MQETLLARIDVAEPRPDVVLVDASATADTSVTVMDILAETDQQLARQGIELWVAALPTRALAKARRAPAWSAWAEVGKLHRSLDDAMTAFERRGTGAPSPQH